MNQAVRPPTPFDDLFDTDGSVSRSAATVLRAAREHLGMDVAFISEFRDDGSRIIRLVDNRDPRHAPLAIGAQLPLREGYCLRVVEGGLPGLIPDTSLLPAAMEIPATRHLPIGAHLSVPIRLSDGHVYGTFCCFSFAPDRSLNGRDLGMMQALADLVARQIDRDLGLRRERDEVVDRITGAMVSGQPDIVYQPIVNLQADWGITGVEVLSRFRLPPERGPDAWFREANEVGLGPALELHTIRRALHQIAAVPGDFYVTVNCSPATLLEHGLAHALEALPPGRLVIEITEHARVDDYDALAAALQPHRERGVRLAIDDAGAGYSSMRHILILHPEFIKLDTSLTRTIDNDWGRHSLAGALVGFATNIGSTIVAEGVETAAELAALHRIGVHKGQGYFLHRPLPLAELKTLLATEQPERA